MDTACASPASSDASAEARPGQGTQDTVRRLRRSPPPSRSSSGHGTCRWRRPRGCPESQHDLGFRAWRQTQSVSLGTALLGLRTRICHPHSPVAASDRPQGQATGTTPPPAAGSRIPTPRLRSHRSIAVTKPTRHGCTGCVLAHTLLVVLSSPGGPGTQSPRRLLWQPAAVLAPCHPAARQRAEGNAAVGSRICGSGQECHASLPPVSRDHTSAPREPRQETACHSQP